LTDTGTDR